jgi:hypothetical protein
MNGKLLFVDLLNRRAVKSRDEAASEGPTTTGAALAAKTLADLRAIVRDVNLEPTWKALSDVEHRILSPEHTSAHGLRAIAKAFATGLNNAAPLVGPVLERVLREQILQLTERAIDFMRREIELKKEGRHALIELLKGIFP